MAEKISLEQFEEITKGLPEDVDRKKVAKALGLELPTEPPPPLDQQLAQAAIVTHTPKITKRNPEPQENTYVSIPSLKLDTASGTRGFWVNTRVARQVAERMLALCDENGY